MRLWVWITGMLEGIWLALRHWRRQTVAEDAVFSIKGGTARLGPEVVNHQATATVGGKRHGGFIVKRNRLTVWFQLYDGRMIKRHIRKHFVVETAW